MAESLFVRADEVIRLLGVSKSEAYRIIKRLNDEMASKGYIRSIFLDTQDGIQQDVLDNGLFFIQVGAQDQSQGVVLLNEADFQSLLWGNHQGNSGIAVRIGSTPAEVLVHSQDLDILHLHGVLRGARSARPGMRKRRNPKPVLPQGQSLSSFSLCIPPITLNDCTVQQHDQSHPVARHHERTQRQVRFQGNFLQQQAHDAENQQCSSHAKEARQ